MRERRWRSLGACERRSSSSGIMLRLAKALYVCIHHVPCICARRQPPVMSVFSHILRLLLDLQPMSSPACHSLGAVINVLQR